MIKKIICIMTCTTMLIMVLASCKNGEEPQTTEQTTAVTEATTEEKIELSELAKTFITNITEDKSQDAWEMFDKTVKSMLKPDALMQTWQTNIIIKLGDFKEILNYEFAYADGYNICFVYTAHNDDTTVGVTKVVFDGDKKIAGIFFYTAAKTSIPLLQIGTNDKSESALPDNVTEITVVIGEDTKYPLDGRLTLPKNAKGPLTAVVMVSGSGPNDKDETLYGNKPFRDIAYYLSENGYAVLRYDKRTYAYGQQVVDDFGSSLTVKEEYIEDALLAKQVLEKNLNVDSKKIYILGHSQGGMLAPRIADEGDFFGTIIMAGSMRSLPEITPAQYEYLYSLSGLTKEQIETELKPINDDYNKYLTLKNMTDEEAKNTTIMGLPAYYLKESDAHKASDYLSKSTKPTLILQGKADYQVLYDVDYQGYLDMAQEKDNMKCILYDGLNHLFMKSAKEKSTPDEYEIKSTVDNTPLADIVAFLKSN